MRIVMLEDHAAVREGMSLLIDLGLPEGDAPALALDEIEPR